MKITALSDVHGRDVKMFDPCGADLCLIAGDIAPCHAINNYEKARQHTWIRNSFCSFIADHPKTEFVFVAGNHDFWGELVNGHEEWWPSNAHYLKNSSVVLFDGLSVWGSPNVPYIGSRRLWAFESSANGLAKCFGEMPQKTDIVITHCPPMIDGSFIDVPCGAVDVHTNLPLHLGSEELFKQVSKVQPRLMFCGHIHTGDHSLQKIGDTSCYNVSLLDESYNWSFYPLRIEI